MNKISDEEIKKYLQEQYDYLIKEYNSNSIVGLFTYGMINYGFAETIRDIKSVVLYLPTFEEMCLNIPYIRYIEDPIHNTMIRFTDVRLLYDLAKNQDLIVMESTFSEYNILNPKYTDIFNKYIYMNKESIFHYNESIRIENAIERCTDLIEEIESSFNQSTPRQYFEICRIRVACELYLSGVSIENCINIKKDYLRNYLQQILNGDIVPDLKEIENDLDTYQERAKDLIVNDDSEEMIKKCILDMVQLGISATTLDSNFLDSLTKAEKNALRYLVSKLDNMGSGNVSISTVVSESGISRPVFKNALQKMETYHVANIVNQGVKGMKIDLIDMSILNIIDNI